MDRRRLVAMGVGAALALTAVAACEPLPPPDGGSVLIGCDRADERVVVTASSHLDPACTYTAGLDISTSGVTLDCQGATIRSAPGAGGRGIRVSTPVDTPLAGVTVRNCTVDGFLNSLRITRDGFRTLPAGRGVRERHVRHRRRGLGVPRTRVASASSSTATSRASRSAATR